MAESTAQLLFDLFLMYVSAKALGEIFARLRLTAVLGELLAGVLLGPGLLHWVAPTATVNSIAELGAVFLLFTVGLETSPQSLVKVGRVAFHTAAAGVAVPFVLGFAYLLWLGDARHEAAFVAAAMVATSVGITARLLRDLGVLGLRSSRIVLAAAVFDDILGLLLLGVVSALATGNGAGWWHLGLVAAEALAFALFMLLVAPRIVGHMRPGLETLRTLDAPLVAALALCLGLSALTSRIGMAAIIGAFFAGLTFADYPSSLRLQPKAQAINQLLSPLFFFAMGARLELSVFTGPVLTQAAVITLLALASKVIGCGAVNYRAGWREALRIGVAMTPRGEVALIVALIGLQSGMIGQRAYAVAVFMTAVTTLLPAIALPWLYRGEGPAPEEGKPLDGEVG